MYIQLQVGGAGGPGCLSVRPACLPAHLSVDWSACPSVYSSKIEAARTSPPARFPAPHPPNCVMKDINK